MSSTHVGSTHGEDLLTTVRGSRLSLCVTSDDVETTALELADALEADIVDAGDLDERVRVLSDRLASAPPPADVRALAGRIRGARTLAAGAERAMHARGRAATDLALHPDALRHSAAALLDARADLVAAEEALESLDDLDASQFGADAGANMWDEEADATSERHLLRWVVFLLVVCLVIGALFFQETGGSLGLLVPVASTAVVFTLIVLHGRREVDAPDDGVETANLAAVMATADSAYGGGIEARLALEHKAVDESEHGAAQRELLIATRALRVAERTWESLVGIGVPVERLEAEIAVRDAQALSIGPDILALTPTVRAAVSRLRRLEARWKLLFWELDLEPADPTNEDVRISCPLVVADEECTLDEATLGDRAPDAIRLVVVQPKG